MALPSSRPVSPRSTADAGGLEVFGLDPRLLPKALAIRDWLLTEATQLADPGQILPGFAERLIALGIPIDRIMSAIDLLHSQYSGVGRIWTKEEGTTSRLFPHGPDHDRVYNESPFAHVHRTRGEHANPWGLAFGRVKLRAHGKRVGWCRSWYGV